MANKRKPAVPDELLDQLLDGSDALEAFQSGDIQRQSKLTDGDEVLELTAPAKGFAAS